MMNTTSASEEPRLLRGGIGGSGGSGGKRETSASSAAKARIRAINKTLAKAKPRPPRSLKDRELYSFVNTLIIAFIALVGTPTVEGAVLVPTTLTTDMVCVLCTIMVATIVPVVVAAAVFFTCIVLYCHSQRNPDQVHYLTMACILVWGFQYQALPALVLVLYLGVSAHFGHFVGSYYNTFRAVLGAFLVLAKTRIAHHWAHFHHLIMYMTATAILSVGRVWILYSLYVVYTHLHGVGFVGSSLYAFFCILMSDQILQGFVYSIYCVHGQVLRPDVTPVTARLLASISVTFCVIPCVAVITALTRVFMPSGEFIEESMISWTQQVFTTAEKAVGFFGASTNPARITMWGAVTGLGNGALWELLLEEIGTLALVWSRTSDKVVRADKVRSVILRIVAATGNDKTSSRIGEAHERLSRALSSFPDTVREMFKAPPSAKKTDNVEEAPYDDEAHEPQPEEDTIGIHTDPPKSATAKDFTFNPKNGKWEESSGADGGLPELAPLPSDDLNEAKRGKPTPSQCKGECHLESFEELGGFAAKMNSLNHHKNAKDFVVVAGLMVCLLTYAGGDTKTFELEAGIEAVKKWATTTSGVTDVLTSVYRVGNLAVKCFSAFSLAPLFDSTSKFCKWEADVKDYASEVQRYASQTTVSLEQMLDKGRNLMCIGREVSLEAQSVGGKCWAVYTDTARLLRTAYATLETKHANSGIRQEPLGVCLHGPPGIGKSFITDALHRAHCMVQGVEMADGSCFTYTGDTDFMDGLTSNVITFVLDDVGKNNNKAIPMDTAISVIIGVINSTPYVPNMASLDDKGKTVFKPKLVIATTNTLGFNARAYVATPDAVWRRFPIVIQPVVKKKYRDDDGTKLDVTRTTPPKSGFPDWWDFEVSKVITKGNQDPIYERVATYHTTAGMVSHVMKRLKKNKANFAKIEHLNKVLDNATHSLCEECFRPTHDCDAACEFSNDPCAGYISRNEQVGEASAPDIKQGEFEEQSYAGGAYDRSPRSAFQTCMIPFHFVVYWIGKIVWFCFTLYYWCAALCAFMVGLGSIVELCLAYMGAWGSEDDSTIHHNILSWTLKSNTDRAKQVRREWMNVAGSFAVAALLYGLGRAIKWRIDNVYKKIDQSLVVDHKVPSQLLGKSFVTAAGYVPQAAWPTATEDTPCVWRKAQFDRVTAVPEYSRTSKAEDVKRIVDDKHVFITFHRSSSCDDSSFMSSVHGLYLNNTTIVTVSHAIEPYKDRDDVWIRVYTRGGIMSVIRKFDSGATYFSTRNPDVCAFWFQGQLPGIMVRDDPEQTPFVGEGHNAVGPCIMSLTTAYLATKGGCDYPQCQQGSVVEYMDNNGDRIGNFAKCKGRVAFSEIDQTGPGACGSPLLVKTGPSTTPKLSILGLHIGKWNSSVGAWAITTVVDGKTAVELVKGLDRVQSDRRGESVSDPLIKTFSPSGPFVSESHHLVDSGPNSAFSATWLMKESTSGDGVRVTTFGTLTDSTGALLTSGVGGKTPVTDTPFRSVAEELGYKCDKVGANFTHTYKTKHLLKVDGGLHSPPAMMVDVVAKGVLDYWKETLTARFSPSKGFYGTYLLPWEQAVNGIPDCTYFDRLNMNSSAGYPWRCAKKAIFQRNESGNYDIPASVMERIAQAEALYDAGKLAGHVFTASFKHEPVSPEKIQAHKGRVIYAGPVDYSIMVRRYFGTLMVHLQHNQDVYGSYVGTNPESHAWGKLITRLSEMGCLFAGDYSGFDTSAFSSHMMHTVYGMLIHMNVWLNRDGMRPDGKESFSEVDIKRMWGLAGDTCSPMINFFGDMLQYESLNPSGHPLTTPFNGVGNVVLICCAFVQAVHDRHGASADPTPQEIAAYTRRFFECVRVAVYGDDHVVGTTDNNFDFKTFKSSLAKFGIKVTAADSSKSDGDYTFLPLEEIDFLKRAFVHDAELGVIKAPLRKEVIAKMFCVWVTKPGEDEMEHVASILRAISLAASQHTREYFEEVTSHINIIIDRCGYNRHVLFGSSGLPTYDQYMDAAYKGVDLPETSPFIVPIDGSMEVDE